MKNKELKRFQIILDRTLKEAGLVKTSVQKRKKE